MQGRAEGENGDDAVPQKWLRGTVPQKNIQRPSVFKNLAYFK